MKQMKTVCKEHVYTDVDHYRVNSEKFLSWMLSNYDLLPVEYKFKSKMSFNITRCSASLIFAYDREETDEEYQARLALEKQEVDEQTTKQLKRLRKLADKFGYALTEKTKT